MLLLGVGMAIAQVPPKPRPQPAQPAGAADSATPGESKNPTVAKENQAPGVSPAPTPVSEPAAALRPNVAPAAKPGARENAPKADAELAKLPPVRLASDLFGDGGAFSRPSEMRVTDGYLLGVGDQLQLNVFGGITLEEKVEVGKGGVLTIPRVGAINANGISLGSARELLRAMLSRNYSRFDLDLQVVKVRDVQVFLLGEITKPGSYVVPSVTSIVNLLGLGGGPSLLGSYRNVQLLREGRVVESVDLYGLRFLGKGMKALALKDGDTIFVPLAGAHVQVEGAFKRTPVNGAPLLVELRPDEVLSDLLQWAGGLASGAHARLVTLQRVDTATGNMTVRNIAQDGGPSSKNVALQDGDLVRALARVDRQEGQVEVIGHVRVPGLYGLEPGSRVKDLLQANQLMLPDTYLGRGEILRTFPDQTTRLLSFDVNKVLQGDPAHNLELQSRDRLEFFDVSDLRLAKRVTILGPFTHPGVYEWHLGMHASDLIFRAGVPRLNADRYTAELARTKDGRTSKIMKLNLAMLLSDDLKTSVGIKDEALDPLLEPYDQITLFEVADFKMHRTVRISGQVLHPGVYTIEQEHFTLGELVKRAGGLTQDAMPSGGIFLRSVAKATDLSAKEMEAASGDEDDPTAQGVNEILTRLNETKRTRDGNALVQNPLLHGLIKGRLNRLVVDFHAAVKGDKKHDVELIDGDEIVIPRMVDNVYVVGEVASPFSSFVVKHRESVGDVIELAGGLTRNADRGQIRLLKANGRIVDTWIMSRRAEPGDTVLVPQKIKTLSNWQDNLQALTPLALLINTITR
jgi:protein involved in polysaccharide export with SLBB domain